MPRGKILIEIAPLLEEIFEQYQCIGLNIKGLIIECTFPENLPSPLFAKEGHYSSLFLLGEPA
ncbi:MAG: hypothetical protein M0Z67_16755 [Nitrospiraceae bacterium]|nr:hypothetical protein [Nitrospiraceae bacterium]